MDISAFGIQQLVPTDGRAAGPGLENNAMPWPLICLRSLAKPEGRVELADDFHAAFYVAAMGLQVGLRWRTDGLPKLEQRSVHHVFGGQSDHWGCRPLQVD